MQKLIQVLCLILLLGFNTFALATNPGVYTEDKLTILVNAKQPQFTIQLKSNPTTGYSWFLAEYDSNLIIPLKHQFVAPSTKLVGAPGYQLWTFRVKSAAFVVPHQLTLQFIYTRPWDNKETIKETIFHVMTQ